MSSRLPARPHLDHLKNEAKALHAAFGRGDSEAIARVRAVLGETGDVKLTEAQRVIAREYGFPTWATLRSHVQSSRGLDEATDAFLNAAMQRDLDTLNRILRQHPDLPEHSLHIAAVIGDENAVRRLVHSEPNQLEQRAGPAKASPLVWLSYSPFHGESDERARALYASARALLDAGADPNATDGNYGVPVLYGVTGMNHSVPIARLLLDSGAKATDGESIFHAAERFHLEAMELLLEYGVDLNATGEWGNTPLYFLLRYHDLATSPDTVKGVEWLLEHGADPNVLSGKERENALHVSARRGQRPEIVARFIDRIADIDAPRSDGLSAWKLAMRAGHSELAAYLEAHGARTEALSRADELLAACGRGDAVSAASLTSPDVISELPPGELQRLPIASEQDQTDAVRAYLTAGFPVDTVDERGATALHYAALHGRAQLVRDILQHNPDLNLLDREHSSTALGWACYGADILRTEGGDYVGTVRALLDAGIQVREHNQAAHPEVRALLDRTRARSS